QTGCRRCRLRGCRCRRPQDGTTSRTARDAVDSSHLRKGIRARLGVQDRTALAKKRGAAEAAPRFSLRARIGGPASYDTVRDRPAARGTPFPLLRFRANRSGRTKLDDEASFLAILQACP